MHGPLRFTRDELLTPDEVAEIFRVRRTTALAYMRRVVLAAEVVEVQPQAFELLSHQGRPRHTRERRDLVLVSSSAEIDRETLMYPAFKVHAVPAQRTQLPEPQSGRRRDDEGRRRPGRWSPATLARSPLGRRSAGSRCAGDAASSSPLPIARISSGNLHLDRSLVPLDVPSAYLPDFQQAPRMTTGRVLRSATGRPGRSPL
jgi:hypothetical protein